jgi:hypothetical protein
MSDEVKTESRVEQCSDEHHHHHHGHDAHCHHKHQRNNVVVAGPIWCIGWLFTLGCLHPTFWKGVLALILWPYYLGQWVATLQVHNLTTLVR